MARFGEIGGVGEKLQTLLEQRAKEKDNWVRRKSITSLASQILAVYTTTTGVAVIWGPPDYGHPRPSITSDIGTGVTISLSDMRFPHLPTTLAVWGSSVIWGSLLLHVLLPYPAQLTSLVPSAISVYVTT